MNDQYGEIQQELMVTKHEIVDRLSKAEYEFETSMENVQHSVLNLYEEEKNAILHQHLRDELDDVNRALIKIDLGLFGVCEETGETIPLDQLKVIPTARTMKEASLTNKFYKTKQSHPYSFSS